MKKVTSMLLAVVFVLSLAGGASARNAGLSESAMFRLQRENTYVVGFWPLSDKQKRQRRICFG